MTIKEFKEKKNTITDFCECINKKLKFNQTIGEVKHFYPFTLCIKCSKLRYCN